MPSRHPRWVAAPPSTSTPTSSSSRSTARSCTRSSWPSWPRAVRARTRPRPAAWSAAAARSRGARRARAALAPAPAARRSGPAAASSSAPARVTTSSRSTARRAAPRCAPRCRCTPSAATIHVVDVGGVRRAEHGEGRRAAARPPRRFGAGRAGRRRADRGQVLPQPLARARPARRRRRRGRPRPRGDARALAGARWTTSRRAPARRRSPDGPQPGDHPPGRLREELRPGDRRQVHVPRARQGAQDADQAGRRGAVRRSRRRGPHLQGPLQAQAPRRHRRSHPGLEEGRGPGASRRDHPDLPGPRGRP